MAVDFTTLRSRQRQKTTARSSRTCREHGKTEAASLRPGMRFRLVPRAFAALHSLPSECTRRPRHAPTCGPAHHSHSAAGKSRQCSSSSKPADASQTLPATSPPKSHSTESNAALHPHPPQKAPFRAALLRQLTSLGDIPLRFRRPRKQVNHHVVEFRQVQIRLYVHQPFSQPRLISWRPHQGVPVAGAV